MAKFPLLEQLRAENQRNENEITLPYKAEIVAAARALQLSQERLAQIERFIGSDIGRMVLEDMRRELADAALRQFDTKLDEAGVMDSFQRRRFADELLSDMRPTLRLEARMEDRVTIADIRIPSLAIRRPIQGYA